MAQVPHHQTSDSNSHHILKQKYFGRGLFFKEMTVWRRLIVVEELGKAIFFGGTDACACKEPFALFPALDGKGK
jgi:hypothetical protein